MDKVMLFVSKYWYYIVGIIGLVCFWKWITNSKQVLEIGYNPNPALVTITANQAKAYAERLYESMADMGTDSKAIKQIYDSLSRNPEDLKLVYNAFGKRKYGTYGAPMYNWLPSADADLKTWLDNEISSDDFSYWNNLFNAIGVI